MCSQADETLRRQVEQLERELRQQESRAGKLESRLDTQQDKLMQKQTEQLDQYACKLLEQERLVSTLQSNCQGSASKAALESAESRLSSLEDTMQGLIKELGTKLRTLDSGIASLEPRVQSAEKELPRLSKLENDFRSFEPRLSGLDSVMTAVSCQHMEHLSELEQGLAGARQKGDTNFKEAEEKIMRVVEDTSWRLEKRLDEAKVVLDKHSRQLALFGHGRQELESGLESLKRQVELQKDIATKAATDAAKAVAEAAECSKQFEIAHSEQEISLQQHLDRWALQAKDEISKKIIDSESISSFTKDVKQLRDEAKAESRQLKEDLMQLIKSQTGNCETQIGKIQERLKYLGQSSDGSYKEVEDRLRQSLQEGTWQADKKFEEAKSLLDKHARQLAHLSHGRQELERGLDLLRRQFEQDREASTKAASEAARAAAETAECSKQLLADHADRESALRHQLEKWSLQAQDETAQKVLSASEMALADLLERVDRNRAKGREENYRLREELIELLQASVSNCDKRLSDVQDRFKAFVADAIGSIGDLSKDVDKIRQREMSLFQESTIDASTDTLPGLREIRFAISEDTRIRDEERRRLQERLRDYCDAQPQRSERSKASYRSNSVDSGARSQQVAPVSRTATATHATLVEGLRGCEVALVSFDRRLSNLEETVDDRLSDVARGERSASLQKGQLKEMESKVEKLVNALHTPSGHQAAMTAAAPGSRDAWRQQFRSALGDSLYVKKALRHRSASVDSIRPTGCF